MTGFAMRKKPDKGEQTGGERGNGLRLIEVHRAINDEEALVVKGLLESQGIHCILRSRVVHAVHPFSMNGLGEVKILVAEIDAPDAKSLLSTSWKPIPPRPARR
jgi:hypothetical protein